MKHGEVVKAVRVMLVAMLAAAPVLGGFAGTDVFLPSVGAKPGVAPAVWYTTVWVHNPNPTPANVTFHLLERQANPAPLTFTDTVPAGDTRKYENAVQTMFARQTFGALRVTSNVKVVVGSRIYSQSGDLDDSVGQFFAGVPTSFAIGAGQTTELLGVYGTLPAASSTFRYNFGFVETTGTGTCQVKVAVKDPTGAEVGSKTYSVRQWEQVQKAVKDEFPSLSTQNARLTVEVTSGTGKVIAFGSSVANGSQDPATFEMAFRDSLLAENSSGGGLSEVSHDGTLEGAGTTTSPLGVADGGVSAGHIASGQVVKSVNGLKDGVTLAAGANVTITPSGNTLTIAATGGGGGTGVPSVNGITGAVTIAGSGGTTVNTAGSTITVSSETGGLSLPYSGTGFFSVSHSSTAISGSTTGAEIAAIQGRGTGPTSFGVEGWVTGANGTAVSGVHQQSDNGGVLGTSQYGVRGYSSSHMGVSGVSVSGTGTYGQSTSGAGIIGQSTSGVGVKGTSSGAPGVLGQNSSGVEGSVGVKGTNAGTLGAGVWGEHTGSGWGVRGSGTSGYGVVGESTSSAGVRGISLAGVGVEGQAASTDGVAGTSESAAGVHGFSNTGSGVEGSATSSSGIAVKGVNATGVAVYGLSGGAAAVVGDNNSGADGTAGVKGTNFGSQGVGVWGEHLGGGWGVYGASGSSHAVHGSTSTGVGIYGVTWGAGYAGYFEGNVNVAGTLSKAGGSFRIDHPQDPANKVLAHSFVESPDMMNVYNGNVVTDDDGRAVVELPVYFEALNRDFRYQLTVIGRFAQAIVEEEVAGNRFVIRTNLAGVKVSWQVTGIRKDPWAEAHRIVVEQDKPEAERGRYLHPELHGVPREEGIGRVPEPARVR